MQYSPKNYTFAMWGIVGIGCLMRLAYVSIYLDFGWEPDSYQHILDIYKATESIPTSLWQIINVWSKPLYTGFYSVIDILAPDTLPRLYLIQSINALLYTASAILVLFAIREEEDTHIWSLPLLVLSMLLMFSFIPFRSSISALTEPIGAFFCGLSLFLFSKRAFHWSCFSVGLASLARIDVALPCIVFVAFLTFTHRQLPLKTLTLKAFAWALCALAPLIIWNLLGFAHTGQPLYLLTSGYPTSKGVYGYGDWLYYLRLFWDSDPLFVITHLIGLTIALPKFATRSTRSLAAVVSLSYIFAMSYLWVKGSFGLAGLGRYFVVVLPFFFINCFDGIRFLSRFFLSNRSKQGFVAAFFIMSVLGLRPLIKEPKWKYGQWSAPASITEPYYRLKEIGPLIGNDRVFSDRPEVLYYLKPFGIKNFARLKRPKKAHGWFVVHDGWSDNVSGVGHRHFRNAEIKLRINKSALVYYK